MVRRGWSVIVLMAAALLAYLVVPDRLVSVENTTTVAAVHQSATQQTNSIPNYGLVTGLLQEAPEEAALITDKVTLLPRKALDEASFSAEEVPSLPSPTLAEPFVIGRPGIGTACPPATLRPSLSSLQILRC